MMKLTVNDFADFHLAVHGRPPFAWQTRLLHEITCARAWPRVLDLPTGAGKTTCIDIALFALALDAEETSQRWCPRRIAMVVDRRIVVDQVAERGRRLLHALLDAESKPVVRQVADRLRSLSKESEEPLAVFTLRGGMPKDDTWARTPDQPLVLASTVDQLGSRLLLQGYGVSKGMRPVHAGLLGNDVLLLLDEVHLSQPFADTLNALDHLRGKFASSSLSTRFHHTFLSATPGASDAVPFRLSNEEKSPSSALGPRLHAAKPVRLLEASERTALEKACVDEAGKLIRGHDVIAVVVNRVASASTIAAQLREILAGTVDVTLLTGRMRPLDRDDVLRALRPRIMTGRDRSEVGKKLIVVGTQCIEAGADFDFDALVTEAASFDALRQRFGRVDRLGLYGKAEGVIVRDKSVKDDDPVYGGAISNTVAWLKARLAKSTKTIDFGVLNLPVPSEEEMKDLLAPKPHAPVLLPAYLDLWMQTSPAPVVVPEVGLWLHGPKSRPADVQVVWRADLGEDDLERAFAAREGDAERDLPTAIVAAVRPSSLEAVSLPFTAVRRWMNGEEVGDIADVEGGTSGEQDAPRAGHRALRWDGDDSEVIAGGALRPGDTIVVPATRGGIRDGCFDARSAVTVVDLAERAALFGRGQPVLRLEQRVLAQLGLSIPIDDPQEIQGAIETLAEEAAPTSWRKPWFDALKKSPSTLVVEAEVPWTVLQGKRIAPRALQSMLKADDYDTIEDGLELTTDDDDSFHAGRSVSLAEHSSDVESFARRYARSTGLPTALVEDVALAGWLHDIGKADRRFQILLRGGSEIAFFKDETP